MFGLSSTICCCKHVYCQARDVLIKNSVECNSKGATLSKMQTSVIDIYLSMNMLANRRILGYRDRMSAVNCTVHLVHTAQVSSFCGSYGGHGSPLQLASTL